MRSVTHTSLSDNAASESSRLQRLIDREFYAGRVEFEAHPRFGVTVEQGLNGPARVMMLTLSGLRFRYTRSSQQVRTSACDLDVFWLVRRGRLVIEQDGRTCVARSGGCVLSNSRSPMSIDHVPDADGRLETLAITASGHLTRTLGRGAFEAASPISLSDPNGALAERTFQLLLDLGRNLPDELAHPLVATSIKALQVAANRSCSATTQGPRSVDTGRWLDVKSCIDSHFSDPHLSAAEIARRCRMSHRRLCQLAQSQETTVRALLWGKRLDKARAWLRAPEMQRLSVSEIAAMSGFKSLAHFSRRFSARFRVAPSQFRGAGGILDRSN